MSTHIVHVRCFIHNNKLYTTYWIRLETTGYTREDAAELIEMLRETLIPNARLISSRYRHSGVREYETSVGVRHFFLNLGTGEHVLPVELEEDIQHFVRHYSGLPMDFPAKITHGSDES